MSSAPSARPTSSPAAPKAGSSRSFPRATPLFVVGSLLAALGLTAWGETHAGGQRHDPRSHTRLSAASDATELRVLDWTLWNISKYYVEPDRIDPRKMTLAGLQALENDIAEVLIEPVGNDKVRVRVGTAEQEFDIGSVEALWAVGPHVREVFRFVTRNVSLSADEQQDAEYAIVAGVLATLDPHTNLLRPADFADMKASTKGSFGGLGIEVGMREGVITVIRVIEGNPASKVDMQPGDRIVQIDAESTVTMSINDAVSRLRGAPGTTVTVHVARDGLERAKPLKITRARITLDSVIGEVLTNTDASGKAHKVGLVQIPRNFAETTAAELRAKLDEFQAAGVEGIVLDLRDNPGGLLNAAVDVADAFLSAGTIVSTVGVSSPREESSANGRYDFPDLPLVVLVDQGSASASEIVAGALRNLGRAVVIGRRTFGKGSVQVLHERKVADKELALKLTIAQYLTPGDVSIQSVGVPPDIETVPVWIGSEHIAYFGRDRFELLREESLSQHLVSNATLHDKTAFGPLYFLDRGSVGNGEDEVPQGEDEGDDESAKAKPPADAKKKGSKKAPKTVSRMEMLLEDAEIRIARDLVLAAKSSSRDDILANVDGFVRAQTDTEQTRIAGSLGKRGIDWARGPDKQTGAPKLDIKVASDKPGNVIKGGEKGMVTVTVTNSGDATAWQVRAITDSDYRYFDERELMFGRIDPGQTKTYAVKLSVSEHELSRTDRIDFHFFDQHGSKLVAGSQTSIDVSAQGLARPQFAFGYQVIDDEKAGKNIQGNGDGALQVGERVKLRVFVKNVGDSAALDTWVTLRNLAGESVFLHSGRERLQKLEPGVVRSVDLDVEVMKESEIGLELLQVSVSDNKIAEVLTDNLAFDLAAPVVKLGAQSGAAITRAAVDLYASPVGATRVVGHAPAGTKLAATATADGWVRVELADDGFAFARAADVELGGKAPGKPGDVEVVFGVSPPKISLTSSPTRTDGETVKLAGTAIDEDALRDVFITVINPSRDIFGEGEKVFYVANKDASTGKLDFSAEVPLTPGNNLVEIHARQ
ncbi:MAG: PDZ domain-containing protein, partial [Deltaproteobacteria bacterium]|nr:PDZ domain-containing protein [Nannocystaceae bacterium]